MRKNRPGKREAKEDSEAIQNVYNDSVREASNVVAEPAGLINVLGLLGFSQQQSFLLAKPWIYQAKRGFERDAPYTFRSIALELLMRRVVKKWPWRGANRADFMYFHYLPFCDIFATDDKTQACYARPWVKSGQQIVGSEVLREDLDEIHGIRSRSETGNGDFPPRESNGLLASTLDKIRPGWRTATYRSLSSDQLHVLNEKDTVRRTDPKTRNGAEKRRTRPCSTFDKRGTSPEKIGLFGYGDLNVSLSPRTIGSAWISVSFRLMPVRNQPGANACATPKQRK